MYLRMKGIQSQEGETEQQQRPEESESAGDSCSSRLFSCEKPIQFFVGFDEGAKNTAVKS